jgi:hypothetical protein
VAGLFTKLNDMIQRMVEYIIRCDKCGEPLEYKEGHPLTSHIGHSIKEDNPEHIKEVAKEYGWKISGDVHLCEKCS